MTVAGIALIAGGLTILVVFRRVLWGSGTSRRVHPVRATRRDTDRHGVDAAPSRSTRHGDGVARPDPESEPWWGQDPDTAATGVEPIGPPSRGVRRRLRRATPEDGRLASIGLADDEDAPAHDAPAHDAPAHDAPDHDAAAYQDAALHDARVHDAALHDAALHEGLVHDAALDDVDEFSADDLAIDDPAVARPAVARPVDERPADGHVDRDPIDGEPVYGEPGPDRPAAHAADLHDTDRAAAGRREDAGRRGPGDRGEGAGHRGGAGRRGGRDRHEGGERGGRVPAGSVPVDGSPPVTSLEPALHRFAHLGSVGATPDDDGAHGHSGEAVAPDGDRSPAPRAAGYRYGDRVDGWVRPDHQQRPVEREPLPAGEYWLPVSDPYADSGYGDHGYGVAPREVAPYEPVPHDVVPHTMSSYEIAPVVEPMPSPPFDASGVLNGERNRPGRDGWRTRSRHASPIDPPSPHFSLFGTPPPTVGAAPFGSRYPGIPQPDGPRPADPEPADLRPADLRPADLRPADLRPGDPQPDGPRPGDLHADGPQSGDDRPGDDRSGDDRSGYPEPDDPWSGFTDSPDGPSGEMPGDGDAGRGRPASRGRRAGTARRTRPDAAPPVDQPVRLRAGYPRSEGRRRHPADPPPITGETTQKLPPLPAGEGQSRPESGRGDGGRPRESEPAGRPRPRPRPRPSGAAQVDEQRQVNRSTVYVSRHAAEPG